ncbi:MAG: hypothetical protein LBO70_04785, partial [Clostridiales Family XIII bacterium]|nr:hypothetical protein [Clostridiales Family XIII bacterium]
YGDTKGALAAVDKLLIGREELDDLAIFLKMKILKRGAAQGQDPDEGAVYSMTAAHDASRLTRTFRGLLMGVKKQNPKNLVVTDRMDQLYHMDDKTLVESLLLSKAAKDFPGMEFMYLNAYALILSAEAGHQVDAAFINNTKAGQAYPVKTIEAALSSGLATEEQYDKASILLKEQMSVYDSNSLGNRVLNFVGNLIGRDLSRERLGLRALDGLIGLEDQPDARELQFALARKTYKINFPVSFDPSGANLMRRVVENTKEGTLFKDDLGHQLDLAAGAVRYNEKMEEAAKARADDIRRRREAAEAEKQGRIKDLRERDREQRTVSNYQEYNLEAIDRLIAARDSRREELIQAKRAAAVSGSAEIAALVLGMTALSAEAQALLGITYERLESDDFKKWDALVEIGKSISKKLGGYFDLAAMTRDPVDRGGDVRDKSDAFMKKLQEFIGFSFKLPFFRSKLSDADIEKRAALADSMNAMFQNPEFLSSAKAALQLSMENHAIDGVALARGLFTSGKGQPSEVEGNIVTSVAQSIKLFDKEDAGGNLLGPSEVRRLRGSAVAADKLRDARLRRIADQNIDDAHRKTRSPELAIAINGLHALLDRLNYVNEESAGISIRTAIDKIFKDVTGVFAKPFNLMSMTVDADALDEDEGRRRAEFLTQADKVRKAQTLYDLKEEASKFLSYIERNDLRELAYAAMMVDSVPITLKELNRYVNTMSELQDFDKEKAALKKYYRVTFDDKVNRFKGAKAGGQLVNEARLDRKAAGIEDDENGVALALAIGAINALLAMSDKTDEHSSWTDERDAFKALFDRIPAKKNLLAMTASKDDSKEPQEIKDINADFDAIFTFVTEANDWPEFSYGMHMLQDFLQLYQLTDRAHAVMTMEAPATQTVRDMDLTETFGKPPTDPSKLTGTDKMLYEIRTAIGKQYADMAVPAMTRKLGEAANADESGADMVFRARDERRFKYGIKDTNVEGATLALTVLAVEDMATFVYSNTSGTGGFFIAGNPEDGLFKARNDEEKSHALVRYGEAFGALRDRMGHLFNLEAMTSSQSDKLDGTHVQRLREDYKYLIDALANTNTEKDFHANARKLLDFSLAHRLKPRAEAAIAMKATKKTFDEKLDNAVGKASNTNGELWAVREGLKQSYAGLISTEVVSPDNPDALLSSDMKERLGALTQITVLGVFRTILPAMPFADFIKELKEPESEVYRLSSERLSAALAAANFKKKDLSGNAPAGSLYRPLAKRGTEGEPSEKSLALAHHLVKGFSSAVGDSPKEWLRTNASKQQSQSSFAQSLAEDKLGKEAGAMHKQLVVSGIIDKLASNMPRDSVLSIANYVGGSAGLSAALSGIDGEFDLGLTRENDLNVEHGGDDSWRVYVGGKLQSKIAASIGASAGLLELEAGVTVDLSGASGMRLEFANEENCKKFLRIFFTGGSPLLDALEPKAKPETAQGAALDPVREALQLSERIIPVKNYEGNIKLETSVSVAGDAPNSVEDAVKKLAEITGLSDLMQKAKAKTVGKASEKIGKKVAAKSSAMVGAGTVSGAVESAADTGIGVAKNKAVGKVEGALKGKMVELGFEDMGEPEEGEATKLHDLSLAASLSIGGKHETEKIAANKDKVTVSVDAEASSKVSVAMFGAGLSEEVERKFSASLERSFTDSQMTGAVMTRTYEIGGESAAADSRRVLSTFGITNVTIERDLEGELSKYDKVSMIIDAELTREGLAKYQEAARENNSLKTMVVLSDRKNYRNSEIRIEVPANESNYEKFLNQQVGAEVLGEGGKVKLGFKFGARGTLIQYWRYNAAMRKAGPQRLSA